MSRVRSGRWWRRAWRLPRLAVALGWLGSVVDGPGEKRRPRSRGPCGAGNGVVWDERPISGGGLLVAAGGFGGVFEQFGDHAFELAAGLGGVEGAVGGDDEDGGDGVDAPA
ncbi:MAG: hypothetical protein KatS3mg108_0326 [Isosphaeraceae bacterium]|nr:MAG: hypothetical protein KatS3mg108_0326 [Isosphaeraceae bacterium]